MRCGRSEPEWTASPEQFKKACRLERASADSLKRAYARRQTVLAECQAQRIAEQRKLTKECYAATRLASRQSARNKALGCGHTGSLWISDQDAFFQNCVKNRVPREQLMAWNRKRKAMLAECSKANKDKPAQLQGPCPSVSGVWETNYGTMKLTQSGTSVSGSYTHDKGKIQGVMKKGVFIGKWSEAPTYRSPDDSGRVTLEFSSDCTSFSGTWDYGQNSGGGAWHGKRTNQKPAQEKKAEAKQAPPTGKKLMAQGARKFSGKQLKKRYEQTKSDWWTIPEIIDIKTPGIISVEVDHKNTGGSCVDGGGIGVRRVGAKTGQVLGQVFQPGKYQVDLKVYYNVNFYVQPYCDQTFKYRVLY
jgi:hypothetical protein